MESKGRIPPPFLRRPIPGANLVHPEPFASGLRGPGVSFPPVERLPPPEILEQKLVSQHAEMQRLVTENQRLANTHVTLRQELAAAQHELQILHAQIGAVKSERELQTRSLMDKIAKMEVELQAAEPIKSELQQARADAQNLIVLRQELVVKAQQLTQDLQRAHADLQQLPALFSELESLRQEFHHCRVTYDYEKKLYDDHLQQLQVMEKNYMSMAAEVDKLRAELSKTANVERRAGGPQSGATGNSGSEVPGHSAGQAAHGNGNGIPQAHGLLPPPVGSGGTNTAAAPVVAGTPPYVGAPSVAPPVRPTYDAPAAGYNAERVPGYDPYRGLSYDLQKGGPGYDTQRAAGYDVQRGIYSTYKGPGYEVQNGPGYDASRGPLYDPQSRGATGQQHGQIPASNSMPYPSSTLPAQVPPQGGNPAPK